MPSQVKLADLAKSVRAPPAPPPPSRFERQEPPRTFFTPAPAPALPPGHGKGGQQDFRPQGGGVEEKLFIGGLPEEVTEDFLWGMLAPFGRVAEALSSPSALPLGR